MARTRTRYVGGVLCRQQFNEQTEEWTTTNCYPGSGAAAVPAATPAARGRATGVKPPIRPTRPTAGMRSADGLNAEDNEFHQQEQQYSGFNGTLLAPLPDKFSADGDYEEEQQDNPAEGTPILYISPRISDGKVADMNRIEVRVKEGLFNPDDVVILNHPSYAYDYYVVSGVWDAKDGGGTAFIDIPYDDSTGERNDPPFENNPIDHTEGTIEVVGTLADFMGADGEGEVGVEMVEGGDAPNYDWNFTSNSADGFNESMTDQAYADGSGTQSEDFFSAVGKKGKSILKKMIKGKRPAGRKGLLKPNPAKQPIKMVKHKGKKVKAKFFTKLQALNRKKLKAKGKSKGLKGKALRSFIRGKK